MYQMAIRAIVFTAALLVGLPAQANDGARLQGAWQCQETGERYTLEFGPPGQLRYNGAPTRYQLLPNILRVQEDYGVVDYYYEFRQKTLIFVSPDGSVATCQKTEPASMPRQARPAPGTTSPQTPSGWPPPYQRPQGRSTWEDSDPASLLYKFAGRWDSVTTNTLHNIDLKPDGTYEDTYESGYSGTFSDQGGYQTGSWGAAGSEQGGGHWTIRGTLRQGQITLIDQNGNRTVYNYKVHCRGNECYGSEYFFNGKLYSVKYIYR